MCCPTSTGYLNKCCSNKVVGTAADALSAPDVGLPYAAALASP